jgi:hypothetical protein
MCSLQEHSRLHGNDSGVAQARITHRVFGDLPGAGCSGVMVREMGEIWILA